MSLVEHPQERAWREGEASTVALMGAVNVAVARLVATIRMLIDTGGWGGHGIQSVEHWVTWKAGVSQRRAGDLVRIARRIEELPACWALFEQGRLTEDSMVRIARRVPAGRDGEVAGWAPGMLISQLTRALASCPELPDPTLAPKADPERQRFVRLTQAGLERLDATLVRTGHAGERTKIVLHHVCLCPVHHRQVHDGELIISGDPEAGTLGFYDQRGSPIEPPDPGPPRQLRLDGPSPYTPPFGERLDPRWFGWN